MTKHLCIKKEDGLYLVRERNIKFTYYLQKECAIPGEFPYQSLNRTGKVKLDSRHTESEIIEIIKSYLIENADKAFSGLAMQSDYDEVVVSIEP